jgi:hypothetical protein
VWETISAWLAALNQICPPCGAIASVLAYTIVWLVRGERKTERLNEITRWSKDA